MLEIPSYSYNNSFMCNENYFMLCCFSTIWGLVTLFWILVKFNVIELSKTKNWNEYD